MSSDENDLVRRAKQGDSDAFATIYEQFYDKIYSYIYYRVHDQQLAEDLASDVFVRLVKRIDSFEERGRPILAWLYTIAGNLVRDHVRRAKRIEFSAIEDREFASDVDPTASLDLKLDSARLRRALQKLTDEQVNVIVLKFVQGLSNAEVGEVVDKSEGSVKSLQHRALRSLKRLLEEEESD